MADEIKLTSPDTGAKPGGESAPVKPVTVKPVAKPVAAKPVAAQPVAAKPVAAKPVAAKPADGGDAPTIKASTITKPVMKTATIKAKRPTALAGKAGATAKKPVMGAKPTAAGEENPAAAAVAADKDEGKADAAEKPATAGGPKKTVIRKPGGVTARSTVTKSKIKKPVAGASSNNAAAPKKASAAPTKDSGAAVGAPPRAVGATIMLVLGVVLSLVSVVIMSLGMMTTNVATGMRKQIGSLASGVDGVPLGPEEHKLLFAPVKEEVGKINAGVASGNQLAAQSSAFLRSGETEMPGASVAPVTPEPAGDAGMGMESGLDDSPAGEPAAADDAGLDGGNRDELMLE